MTDHLLQETGDRILLEDGTGFLILESGVDDTPMWMPRRIVYEDVEQEILLS
jgi:hypothetical protein